MSKNPSFSGRIQGQKFCPFESYRENIRGNNFVEYLKSNGTHQKLNVHNTHHQTGVAERHNQMIAERIHVLLHASGPPKNLWGEVARHVVWLLNRTMMKAVEGMTPY